MPGADLPDVFLRFVGDEGEYLGESNDESHPGSDGWISIKAFNFGFGFDGKSGAAQPEEEEAQKDPGTSNPQAKPKAKSNKAQPMRSGPMTFDPITFSKTSDALSVKLMSACKNAKKINRVELHTCRAGGSDGDVKTVFLALVFEDVHIKTCKLNLTTEGLPSEDLEFTYEKVEMTSYWTDNATGGDRLKYGPLTTSWTMADGELDEDDDSSSGDDDSSSE